MDAQTDCEEASECEVPEPCPLTTEQQNFFEIQAVATVDCFYFGLGTSPVFATLGLNEHDFEETMRKGIIEALSRQKGKYQCEGCQIRHSGRTGEFLCAECAPKKQIEDLESEIARLKILLEEKEAVSKTVP